MRHKKLSELIFDYFEQTIVNFIYRSMPYEVAATLWHAILGGIGGGLSLIFMPNHILSNIQIRMINLIITPFIIGGLMNLSGNIKYQNRLFKFDLANFLSGYSFALALAIVRFVYAQ